MNWRLFSLGFALASSLIALGLRLAELAFVRKVTRG